jgi:LPXTG-site transpeptidase (sortase) family protein
MKKNILLTVVTLSVIFLATFLFIASRVQQEVLLPSRVSQGPTPTIKPIKSAPTRIAIDSLGITVPVTMGAYDIKRKTWTLSWDSASFANMTAVPNTLAGKTIIYGHNTKKLFGRTKDIKPGDTAIVTTEDGSQYTYEFIKEDVVTPETTDVFRGSHEGSPQLVLLTCGGFLNQDRHLLYFNLVKAEHAERVSE